MTTQSHSNALRRLSDAHLQVAEPAEDIRGREVRDSSGAKIGKVHDLFVDEVERRVRLLEVVAGGFLGIGQDKFLVPIDAVQAVSADAVQINQDSAHLSGAPQYDPELIDEDIIHRTYAYYGYAPFWDANYIYPARWYV